MRFADYGNGMRNQRSRVDEIRTAWAQADNDDLRKAVLENWDDYSAEAQESINEEIIARKLGIVMKPITGLPLGPTVSFLTQWSKSITLVLLLILIPALCLGINLGLWFYYECRDKPILANIDRIETFIKGEKEWILQAEKNLEHKEAEIQKLMKNTAGSVKVEDSANSKVLETEVEKYNTLRTEYENRLRRYNEKVDEHNALIKKIDTRWYLIPIPK